MPVPGAHPLPIKSFCASGTRNRSPGIPTRSQVYEQVACEETIVRRAPAAEETRRKAALGPASPRCTPSGGEARGRAREAAAWGAGALAGAASADVSTPAGFQPPSAGPPLLRGPGRAGAGRRRLALSRPTAPV